MVTNALHVDVFVSLPRILFRILDPSRLRKGHNLGKRNETSGRRPTRMQAQRCPLFPKKKESMDVPSKGRAKRAGLRSFLFWIPDETKGEEELHRVALLHPSLCSDVVPSVAWTNHGTKQTRKKEEQQHRSFLFFVMEASRFDAWMVSKKTCTSSRNDA